jgi:putative heme-binding domain-containing protein
MRRPSVGSAIAVTVGVMLAVSLSAQHTYTPADVENGGRLYLATCVGCHGPNGDAVAGVSFSGDRFRRASTDEEIVRIIVGGIAGTSMPPNNFTDAQAATIVAYLRSMASASTSPAAASAAAGDAARGRSLLEGKGQCLTCHRVSGVGSRLGPDLTDVGALRRPDELRTSVLDPDAEVLADHRFVRAVTRDGTTISGRLLNQDNFSIQLLDTDEKLRSLAKSALREHTILKKSEMPSYRDKLSEQEVADLVGYLASLKERK